MGIEVSPKCLRAAKKKIFKIRSLELTQNARDFFKEVKIRLLNFFVISFSRKILFSIFFFLLNHLFQACEAKTMSKKNSDHPRRIFKDPALNENKGKLKYFL